MEQKIYQNDRKYLRTETIGGLVLLIAAVCGVAMNNSSLESMYDGFINFPIKIQFINFDFTKPLLFWINDGLVSLFFLLIGLEIKYMMIGDDAYTKSHFVSPLAAAIMGAIVPAIIFTLFNKHDPIAMRGWAIPTAMDTAFILGIIALIGSSISSSLKLFVMTLSIIDDIIAVMVIAIFYADNLSNLAIVCASTALGILIILNKLKINNGNWYLLFGFMLWVCVLGSGVHTSIAGVLVALTIPFNKDHPKQCMLIKTKNRLHPWVAFVILPIFAFANSGVEIEKISFEMFLQPLSLGIVLGLFLGKQLGIFGITYLLSVNKIIKLPENTTLWQMYGTSVLCGIGFTMSLFIGFLAFENGGPEYNEVVKASVFTGSLLSAVVGYMLLMVKR